MFLIVYKGVFKQAQDVLWHFLFIILIATTNLIATNPWNVISRADLSSVNNNIKFQIFQKCFQNVQLVSISPINWLYAYADSC